MFMCLLPSFPQLKVDTYSISTELHKQSNELPYELFLWNQFS